ncbi:MAG: hypothetical protein ACT4OZ_12235 [Gemmatimonadota bacterium]
MRENIESGRGDRDRVDENPDSTPRPDRTERSDDALSGQSGRDSERQRSGDDMTGSDPQRGRDKADEDYSGTREKDRNTDPDTITNPRR